MFSIGRALIRELTVMTNFPDPTIRSNHSATLPSRRLATTGHELSPPFFSSLIAGLTDKGIPIGLVTPLVDLTTRYSSSLKWPSGGMNERTASLFHFLYLRRTSPF